MAIRPARRSGGGSCDRAAREHDNSGARALSVVSFSQRPLSRHSGHSPTPWRTGRIALTALRLPLRVAQSIYSPSVFDLISVGGFEAETGGWISTEIVPLCPVTSQPAIRRVQTVTTRLLVDLWRIIFNTDARESLAGIDRIGLWESPTGLYFFDPPLEGDHKFYTQFYARLKRWRLFSDETVREEFLIASKFIPSGARPRRRLRPWQFPTMRAASRLYWSRP
jgi:hypothetical protein